MAITSVFLLNAPVTEDANGRKLIVEQHTDSISGRVRVFYYVASAGTTQAQIDAIMASRNADLTTGLVENDVAAALYGDDPAFVWQTATNDDVADTARADYLNLPQGSLKRVKLAKRILEWIVNLRFGANTDNAIRNKFGVSVANWVDVKVRMQALVDGQDVVDNTAGE